MTKETQHKQSNLKKKITELKLCLIEIYSYLAYNTLYVSLDKSYVKDFEGERLMEQIKKLIK